MENLEVNVGFNHGNVRAKCHYFSQLHFQFSHPLILHFKVTFSMYSHRHFIYIQLIPLKSFFSSANKKLTTGKPVTVILFHEGY